MGEDEKRREYDIKGVMGLSSVEDGVLGKFIRVSSIQSSYRYLQACKVSDTPF